MHPTLLPLLTALPLSSASPAHHHRRDLGSAIHSAVANIGNAIHSAASSAASAVPELVSQSGSTLGILSRIPCTSAPVRNEAVWQEALSLDAAEGGGIVKVNQMLYQQIACYQGMENSSHTAGFSNALSSASWIGRGLQGLHAYPAQFGRAQAGGGEEVLVQLSPTPQQTITSFGASGAWWPNFLQDFPPAQQKNLSDLLFSKDGLQLSGYRYNIGASGDHDNVTVSTPGRGAESFLTTAGAYNWQRDGPGVYYLKAAQDAGVASITFFANAIPSNLTSDNATATKTTPCGTTLSKEQIPRFVEYLVNVLAHMLEWGIQVEYISPMNEPDNAFDACTQEGMRVPASLRGPLFQALRTALQAPGLRGVKILGDESSQVTTQALTEYSAWLPASSIDALAAHMYDWPDDATLLNYRQLLVNLSLPNAPPPVKMTEISSFRSARGVYSPWGWTGPKVMGAEFDPGVDSALDMARYVWQWLTLVNAESWDWWTAVSNMMPCSPSVAPGCAALFNGGERQNGQVGYNDGLVYIDPQYKTTKDYGFYMTKRFWVFRHFSRFLRPGAVRYDVPNEVLPYGTVAVAGRNSDRVYSVIFVNRNATSQGVRMKLPGDGGKVTAGVQTTDKADWENIPLPVVMADGTFTMTLPARGVLSIQFTVQEAGAISSRRRTTTGGYEYQHKGGYLDDGERHDVLFEH